METRTVHPHHPRTTRNETITRWSRSARLIIGVLTLVVIVMFGVAAIAALVEQGPPEHVGAIHWMLVLATFAQYLLMLFYVSFAAQNPRSDTRGWWIAGMVLLPWAILPVYWWTHVWNAPYVSDPTRDYNVPGGQLTPQAD